VRRWLPFALVALLSLSAAGAAFLSVSTTQSDIESGLAIKTVALAMLPDGWTDVAGIGVLVESNVPVALRCATPPQVIYGPVVVAREFRSRNSDETIQEMLGLTPAKDELGVRNLLARKQSASGCHSPVGFGWLGTNSSYLRPPFVIDWGWTGYQPLRSIKAPAVLPVDLVSSSGKTFGSGRIFNYFFLKHGVLLRVYAFGSASTKVMQDVVAQMAERA
jgi:hypothetical protein